MNNNEINEKIRQFMMEEFEVEEEKITPDANLKETLGLDIPDFLKNRRTPRS